MAKKLELYSWNGVEDALTDYAAAKNEIAKADALLAEALLLAKMARQQQVKGFEADCVELAQALKKFAQAHKAEFKAAPSGDGRSFEHAGVMLGFRQSPGRVEIRKEEEAIEWLRDYQNAKFVRVVHEPNRELLLETLRAPDTPERLVETMAAHGIKFEQPDKFFLEVLKADS